MPTRSPTGRLTRTFDMPGRLAADAGHADFGDSRLAVARFHLVKVHEYETRVPAPDGEIRAKVIHPVGAGPWPAVLVYTDIFQLTESTLRTARQLASAGFLVCVPEIYPRGELAGV